MRIIVFADSHTDVDTMLTISKSEQADAILHLGDHIVDGLELRRRCDIPIYLVKGNTDKENDGDLEALLAFEDATIYMTHGHMQKVQDGLSELVERGIQAKADISLFGHTHIPYLTSEKGMWLMNPGRVGRISSKKVRATYGIITINKKIVSCKIIEVDP